MGKFLGIIIAIIILSCSQTFAQIEVDDNMIELGIITKNSNRLSEIQFTNNTDKIQEIIKIDADIREFDAKFTSKILAPGTSVTLRIKYNPLQLGIKRIEIPVYFSKSDPIVLKLIAEVLQLNWEDYTPCPDFENPNTGSRNNFTAQFKVVDNANGNPVHNAEVILFEQGRKQATFETNKKGMIEKEVPLAFYEMSAGAEGYNTVRKESYINRRNRYFIFALNNDNPISQEFEVDDENNEELENDLNEEPVVEKIPDVADLKKEIHPEFSISEYAANNVVFLIDVSTSMKKEGRLDLLKTSMIRLLEMLRANDRLCIVTYASSTDVVMDSRFVTDKKEISDLIQNIEGKGLTAGGQGIKKAYQIAQKNLILNGNNQVYLATDGAFNKGEKDVSKFVRKQARKGISMSILGIKSPKWTVEKMKGISNSAKGDYISLTDETGDVGLLNELIKKQSRINAK